MIQAIPCVAWVWFDVCGVDALVFLVSDTTGATSISGSEAPTRRARAGVEMIAACPQLGMIAMM